MSIPRGGDILVAVIAVGFGFNITVAIRGPGPFDELIGNEVTQLKVVRPAEDSISVFPIGDQPHVLYIFDENCPHCTSQLEDWAAIAIEAAQDARFLAVSLRPGNGNYPLIDDPHVSYLGASHVQYLRTVFGLEGVPMTVVIDKQHKIRRFGRGVQSRDDLRRLLRSID